MYRQGTHQPQGYSQQSGAGDVWQPPVASGNPQGQSSGEFAGGSSTSGGAEPGRPGFGGPSKPDDGDAYTPVLSKAFRDRLKPCLNAIDCLRSQGLQRDIRLPAIAVVGDQSVGKSSVLEAISGVEFPRGTGIVTKCPLMLSMRSRDEPGWSGMIKYKTKAGEPREKPLVSAADIGPAIREAQNEMTSSPGEISDSLIELRVESPESPDLTLIDLPGIARYSAEFGGAVAGITKSLILSYIQRPEVIILLVIPCHVDIETVEALSLAKEVDPESTRTIGVLTCPDLVNPGSEPEVLALMRNQKIPLQKGYVSVKCRTTHQLKNNVGLRQALMDEEEFFRSHRYFRALDNFERGSKTLAMKLSSELYDAIRHNVPELMREIQVKREEICKQLESMGSGPPDEDNELARLLARLINKFVSDFASVATGTHRHEPDRLFGRCRRHWETLADAIESCALSDRTEVQQMWAKAQSEINDQRGVELPGFDNIYPVLERIVREYFLQMVKDPCIAFLVSVNQEVDETIRRIADLVFQDYPSFNQYIKEVCEGIRAGLVDSAREQIKSIFEEEEFVFTQDRIFLMEKERPYNTALCLPTHKAELAVSEGKITTDRSSIRKIREESCNEQSRRVLEGAEAYIRVAVRRLQDSVPMAVQHYLLYKMAGKLKEELIVLATKPEPLFEKLRAENPLISAKRNYLSERMEKLAAAEQELARF